MTWGYISRDIQFCWDLGSSDELQSMTRCLPDMMRSMQKHERPWEESKDELGVMNFTSLRVGIEKE